MGPSSIIVIVWGPYRYHYNTGLTLHPGESIFFVKLKFLSPRFSKQYSHFPSQDHENNGGRGWYLILVWGWYLDRPEQPIIQRIECVYAVYAVIYQNYESLQFNCLRKISDNDMLWLLNWIDNPYWAHLLQWRNRLARRTYNQYEMRRLWVRASPGASILLGKPTMYLQIQFG